MKSRRPVNSDVGQLSAPSSGVQLFGTGMLSLLLNAASALFTRLSQSADAQGGTISVTPLTASGVDRIAGALGEPDEVAVLILLLLAGWALPKTDQNNDAGLVILRLNDSPETDAAQQIVGREPR